MCQTARDETLTELRLRQVVGPHAHFVTEIDSTNVRLREMADAGAAAGTLLVADYQRQGKGRRDRRWEAPPGTSLLFSYLFRPQWPAERAPWLTMIAGLAAVAGLPAIADVSPALKWPNDIMLPGAGGWAKAGGILLETTMVNGRLEQAILGMGLNVNIPPEALPATASPATSLLAATGRAAARLPLLAGIIDALEEHYRAADAGLSPQPAWNKLLLTRDLGVTVSDGKSSISGIARGTDAWGRLLVETADGRLHSFAAGDVTLREHNG